LSATTEAEEETQELLDRRRQVAVDLLVEDDDDRDLGVAEEAAVDVGDTQLHLLLRDHRLGLERGAHRLLDGLERGPEGRGYGGANDVRRDAVATVRHALDRTAREVGDDLDHLQRDRQTRSDSHLRDDLLAQLRTDTCTPDGVHPDANLVVPVPPEHSLTDDGAHDELRHHTDWVGAPAVYRLTNA
jgi:hypothetical protein